MLHESLTLLLTWDQNLAAIILLSLKVSLSAVGLACLIGFPLGALTGALKCPGRPVLVVLLNTFMGLPPVVVGLLVYLMLSASGPLGVLGLLYTPQAMIIAQSILITPIIAALTCQVVMDLHREYAEQFSSLGVSPMRRVSALLLDARVSLLTVALAGFGRAIAEVGAVMIVGGNINHVTRVMTTTIALETSKGNLNLAVALGIVLLIIAVSVNGLTMLLKSTWMRQAYA